MARLPLEQSYPGIRFRPHSRGWLARFLGSPAECEHLGEQQEWMAALAPDVLYLRGKAARRNGDALSRPEVSLCRACLGEVLRRELPQFAGRVVAFEPAPGFTQFFFIARPDFEPAGLTEEFCAAAGARLDEAARETCEQQGCRGRATWLWVPRAQVSHLDDTALIRSAPGQRLCPAHGADRLCAGLAAVAEANLLYVNLPYGEQGAYVWV